VELLELLAAAELLELLAAAELLELPDASGLLSELEGYPPGSPVHPVSTLAATTTAVPLMKSLREIGLRIKSSSLPFSYSVVPSGYDTSAVPHHSHFHAHYNTPHFCLQANCRS
jgi:hypothetical protein